MSTKNVLISNWRKKIEPINHFNEDFLISKDKALEPIKFFLEIEEDDLYINQNKIRHLSLRVKKEKNKEKEKESEKEKGTESEKDKGTERTKKSRKSHKSQKSTSNTNKKSAPKKSLKDSQIYNSNIVIVQDEEDDDCSSTDPIEKEVEKLKRFMSRSKGKKKKKTKKPNKPASK